ncbi:MAG: hypothetical protein Q9160_007128 [Pyrenula sp. 1 TL-2023]
MDKHPTSPATYSSPYLQNPFSKRDGAAKQIRAVRDKIITDLNLRYGLDLPKDYGRRYNPSIQRKESLADQCSRHIEFLSLWQDRVHIPAVIQDFEEWAQPVLMKWIPKEKQEQGTLYSQSILSFNRQNAIATAASFTPEQKLHLLEELERRLGEECKLMGDSEVYSRSSSSVRETSVNGKTEPKLSVQRIDKLLKRKKPSSTPVPSVDLLKLSELAYGTQDDTIAKRQSPSKDRQVSTASISKSSDSAESKGSLHHATSFETTASSTPPVIFSQSNATDLTSAATSFVETSESQSTDLFPSQEALEIANDEEFKASFTEACRGSFEPDLQPLSPSSDTGVIVKGLESSGPFAREDGTVLPTIPFRNRYELQRIANVFGISVKELVLQVNGEEPNLQSLWQDARKFTPKHQMMPEKSSMDAWNSAQNTFFHESGSSVTLWGSLEWAHPPNKGMFRVQLQPLKLERSCRFHRKFGADRFFTLRVPSLEASAAHSTFGSVDQVHGAIATWLARSTHCFLGREWRAFYVEKEKRRSKESKEKEGFKVYFFAVDGFDFASTNSFSPLNERTKSRTKLELEKFLNWHLHLSENLGSTDCKLFQRIRLGLSKTHPTVIFEQAEFIHLPDKEPVMNDGCARISMSAAIHISEILGLQNVPSVFQGRIAGAKGMWMVDSDEKFQKLSDRRFAIEISDSQLKILPHPQNCELDIEQRTFEVTEWSRPPRPASLTTQFLTILRARGVPEEVLKDALLDETHSYFESLKESLSDPLLLRTWLQTVQHYARSPNGIRYLGSWPDDHHEQSIQLLESEFLPANCPALRELLRDFLKKYFDHYIDKLAITIPRSTYVYCIADPYGVLAEDEIHLGFSENWKDSKTGFSDNIVDGVEVLVSRSPALLPSDIQRRKACWKRELRHFKDVVVFPTTGQEPLASLLSGGDYDGDRVIVVWDHAFVSNFQNVGFLKSSPSENACHLENVSKKLSVVAQDKDQAALVDAIVTASFSFNLKSDFLGLCNVEHEKLVYATNTLSSSGAILLATLAGYLVDASKQGWSLSLDAWNQVRAESGCKGLGYPAYKQDQPSRHKPTNIIDFLKFEVAFPERETKLTEFAQMWPQEQFTDSHLTVCWTTARDLAERERKHNADSRLHDALANLSIEVDQVIDEWRKKSSQRNSQDERHFTKLVEHLFERFCSITPLHSEHLSIAPCAWENENSRWNSLRASCLYTKHRSSNLVWYMVGQDLCQMKLKASKNAEKGPNRTVCSSIYSTLQVNAKLARRVKNLEVEELEGDDIGKGSDDEEVDGTSY